MRKVKICMLGATRVGKTSLVRRFVHSAFSETYLTTVGVTIETREVRRGDRVIHLVLWDLSGEDEFQAVRLEYLRGAVGYLLVADGTRRETLDTAIALQSAARGVIGDAPFVLVLNKGDLAVTWELDERRVADLLPEGWTVVTTSAKTGAGVDDAFDVLIDVIAPG